MKGQFWVVDGLDGAGKTVTMDKIKKFLTDHNVPFIWTREPGGTPFAELLRDGLKFGFYGLKDYELSPIVQTLLFNAARADHIEKVIKPNMAEGKIVLCDRYKDSTFAYQGGAGRVPLSHLTAIHDMTCKLNPDMVFLMDGDPEVFAKRMVDRGQADKLDALQLNHAEAMREIYQFRAEREPDVYRVIDATQSEEQVYAQILPHLMLKLNELKERPKAEV